MSTASMYGAAVVAVVEDGTDARRNRRYKITATALAFDGTDVTRTVRTRGYVEGDVRGLAPGDRVNIIRDGNGSAIHIERSPA